MTNKILINKEHSLIKTNVMQHFSSKLTSSHGY